MNKVKKLEALLEKLTELYYEANDIHLGSDTAHAISVAEDTLISEIKYEKDVQLALSIVNKNKEVSENEFK